MPVTYVETRDVELSALTRYPGNARRGNVAEIRASLRRTGQYRALVVRDTGDDLVILAGNHTADAIQAEGRTVARCEILTCTEDEGRRINLADNRLAELGSYDDGELAGLLQALGGDFDGTGWAEEDLAVLMETSEEMAELQDVDSDEDEPTRGDLLQLAGVTVGEPRHAVEHGQVWALGEHRLVIADLFTEWHLWKPFLEEGVTFMPYPTPLVPHAPDIGRLVMVQPIPYLAGHLLDKWQNITGMEPAVVGALVLAT